MRHSQLSGFPFFFRLVSNEFLPRFPEFPYLFCYSSSFSFQESCTLSFYDCSPRLLSLFSLPINSLLVIGTNARRLPCQLCSLHPYTRFPPPTLKIFLHDPYSFPKRGLGVYQPSILCDVLSFLAWFLSYMKKFYFAML